MDVSRLVFLAVAALALGLSIPVARAQDDDAVAAQAAQARGPAKPWKWVRGLGRVLDLSKPPVVIDQPGLYAIQQNWRFPPATTDVVTELIQITANDVTLDLHGFEIAAEGGAPPAFTLFAITGHTAEIRNGSLTACCEGGTAVHSTTGGARLHHLSIYSHETMTFDGNITTISDSDIYARVGIDLAGRSHLERNTIGSKFLCVRLSGDGNRVTDNRMSAFDGSRGVDIVGNGNVVANNVMDLTDVVQLVKVFDVRGDHNVLRSNTVIVGRHVETLWQISGTANTLDGNIAAPQQPGEQANIGMEFTADGNYYGDNRMAAHVPFALGGTVQTDWGGNVGY